MHNKYIKYIVFLFIPLSIIGCTNNSIIKNESANTDKKQKVSDSPYYSIAYDDDENLHYITKKDSDIITDYLNTGILLKIDKKIFSVFKVLGTNNNEIYLWVYTSTADDNSSCMAPVLLKTHKDNDTLVIDSHSIPADGETLREDIQKIFPKEIAEKIFKIEGDKETHDKVMSEMRSRLKQEKTLR